MPQHGHFRSSPLTLAAVFSVLTCICANSLLAQPAGFNKRIQIDIDNSALTTTLTDFPVMVKLEDGVNFDYTQIQSDGDDIRFFASDEVTELNFELEGTWDSVGPNYFWVQIPTISPPTATPFFYIYFNNPSGGAASIASTDTWSDNFTLVYHMAETPTDASTVILNSASGVLDGTPMKDAGAGDDLLAEEDGIVGACIDFNGEDNYIAVPFASMIDPASSSFTFTAWVTNDQSTGGNNGNTSQIILQQEDSGNDGRTFLGRDNTTTIGDANDLHTNIYQNDFDGSTNNALIQAVGTWRHVAVVCDVNVGAGTADITLYYNGAPDGTDSGVSTETGLGDYRIGAFKSLPNANNSDWNGFIDEVFFSSDAKSDDWMMAHFLTVTDSANFLTFNAEEETLANDSTVTASGLLTEPSQIDSITASTSTQSVFDFKITDTSLIDDFPTLIEQIEISIAGTADPSEHTWRLTGPDAVAIVPTLSGTVGATTLTFEDLSISVANGSSETYTLTLQTSTAPSNTFDGSTFIFSLNDTSITQPSDQASSLLATGQSNVNNGAGLEFEVVATEVIVTTQPSATETLDVAFDMEIAYVDANESIDLDVAGDVVTVTRNDDSSAVTVTNAIVSAGQLSFTGSNKITLSAPSAGGLQLLFTDDAGGTIDLSAAPATSNAFNLSGTITLTGLSPDAGAVSGGEAVTITGTSLGAATFVSFAGKSATIQSASDTELTVTAPAQPTDLVADVFVTDGSSSATLAASYTYGEPSSGIPVLTGIIPDSGSITGGNVVSLIGNNLSGVFTVTFDGIPAATDTITPTLITVFVPASTINGTGAVDVLVNDGVNNSVLVDGYTYIKPAAPNKGRDVSIINCSLHSNTNSSGIVWATLLGLILASHLYRRAGSTGRHRFPR